jgi:hypothetical protein
MSRAYGAPSPKSVRLVTDLKSEKPRSDRACDVARFFCCSIRRAAREVEAVDEPPIERIKKRRELIHCCRRDDEALGLLRIARLTPNRALAHIAAETQNAAWA